MSSLQKPASNSTGDEARAAEALAYLRAETGAAAAAPRGQRQPGAMASPGGTANPLYALRIGALWRFFTSQSASFWFVCLYLFIEYVRPQQIYESLNVLPWGKVAIALAVLAFLLEGRTIRFELPEKLLLLFTGVLLLSSVAAVRPGVSFGALGDWISWVVIYLLIANTVVTESRFLVFLLSYLVWNFKMSQSGVRSWAADGFAFRDWGAVGAPGWFSNSGEFGIQMCVFLPVTLAFRAALSRHTSRLWQAVFWAMAITAIMSIVASSSRGSLVGLAAMVLWMLPRSRYKWRALVGTVVLGGFVLFILPPEQMQRLRDAGTDKTSTNRTLYWNRGIEVIKERPALGLGYKNWEKWHEANYARKALPHNIFIEAGAEMGLLGLGSFLALIAGTLVINARTRRLAKACGEAGRFAFDMAHGLDAALIGYLASGFFVTVLFYPYFWINLAMTVALNRSARAQGAPVRLPARRGGAMAPVAGRA